MSKDVRQMEDPLGLLRLGYAQPLLEVPARRWEDGGVLDRVETVAEETPVAMVYNGIPHAVMMATPQDLEDFALGFSLTEELIASPADLHAVECVRYSQGIEIQVMVGPEREAEIAARTRRLTGRTGCGICGADSVASVLKTLHAVESSVTVAEAAIQTAMASLASHQTLNAAAGAVHAAGWAALDGTIDLVREDVGRHNALDKLIGALLRRGHRPDDGLRRGHEPGQLRDGSEDHAARRRGHGCGLGTHRPGHPDRAAGRPHPGGIRPGHPPHGVHPPAPAGGLRSVRAPARPASASPRRAGSARSASRNAP